MPKLALLRRTLTRRLEKGMAEPSLWKEEDGRAVEEAKQKILAEVL